MSVEMVGLLCIVSEDGGFILHVVLVEMVGLFYM